MCDQLITLFFFYKQKTAYWLLIRDWSSDVCSSDLGPDTIQRCQRHAHRTEYGCEARAAGIERGHQKILPALFRQIERQDRRSVHLTQICPSAGTTVALESSVLQEIGRAHV